MISVIMTHLLRISKKSICLTVLMLLLILTIGNLVVVLSLMSCSQTVPRIAAAAYCVVMIYPCRVWKAIGG